MILKRSVIIRIYFKLLQEGQVVTDFLQSFKNKLFLELLQETSINYLEF